MEDILHIKLFIDKKIGGILQPDGTVGEQNSKDFFINIPLVKTFKKVGEYVNIERDPFKTIIDRQKFNPHFIELGFFESIKSISGNTGSHESIEEKAKLYNITINK